MNPPSCKSLKGRELITANQRKTEVTSAVKNYQKSLWSQHLLKVGSSDHLHPGKKIATLRCSGFPQDHYLRIKETDLIIVSLHFSIIESVILRASPHIFTRPPCSVRGLMAHIYLLELVMWFSFHIQSKNNFDLSIEISQNTYLSDCGYDLLGFWKRRLT